MQEKVRSFQPGRIVLLWNQPANRVIRSRGAKKESSMEFRPCIDIHNGAVKQIVGGTLRDPGDRAQENFVSEKERGLVRAPLPEMQSQRRSRDHAEPRVLPVLRGDEAQALSALAWPGGLQIGGGINADNAPSFLEAGATTSSSLPTSSAAAKLHGTI
jgi:hypothetical protein